MHGLPSNVFVSKFVVRCSSRPIFASPILFFALLGTTLLCFFSYLYKSRFGSFLLHAALQFYLGLCYSTYPRVSLQPLIVTTNFARKTSWIYIEQHVDDRSVQRSVFCLQHHGQNLDCFTSV